MPGLQKRTRRRAETPSPRGDVENPESESGPTEAAPASAVPSASGHSPILLARMTFRKVLTQLTSDEDDDDESGGIVSFLRDIIVGIIVGLVVSCVMIVLDHRDFIHLESAHNFRDAAHQLLTDPATVASIEESADLKFLTMAKYDSYKSELRSLAEKKAEIEEKAAKNKEMEAENEKLSSAKEEYEKLIASFDPSITLPKWCDECTFEGAVKCMGRVIFIQGQDRIGKVEAKLKIMRSAPQCKRE